MGRGYRKKEPPVRPVIKAELNENHFQLRLVLAIAFGLLAAGMLVYGIVSLLRTDPGWQLVEAKTGEGMTCAGEFSFYYNLGEAGIAASTEYRQLVNVYTDAARHAYRVFDNTMEYAGLGNLHSLNGHIGEKIKIDPLLYNALQSCGDTVRYVFLAPIYMDVANLYGCTDDSQIYPFDPLQNPEEATYVAEIARFASDSDAISIAFYEENTVCLTISDEYAAFAEEYGIETFVDFFYLKNAFVIDYLAQEIVTAGFTRGTLSSYDGYSRNLDLSSEEYTQPIFHLTEGELYPACTMRYTGPMAICYLRAYPLTDMDSLHYYTLATGEIRTPYVCLSDGIARTATDTLLGYSKTLSCSTILVELLPHFAASPDNWNPDGLAGHNPALHVLYITDHTIQYSGDVTIADLYADGKVQYTEKRQ